MPPAQTLFWGSAGLLTLLSLLAVLSPLLGPGRKEPSAAATPASRRRGAAWALALVTPAAVLSLYLQLGAPDAVRPEVTASTAPHRLNEQDMDLMVERLVERLRRQPDDVEGWFMLARSQQALGRWEESVRAYREAHRLAPQDPGLLADLADVLATSQAGDLEGEPRALLARALELDPGHPKSLALAAMAEFRQGRFAAAITHWERLAALAPEGSEAAALARRGLDEARARGPVPAASVPSPD